MRQRNRDRVVIKNIKGISYELHLDELIDSSLYYDGCFELYISRAIEQLVKPGMTVLDIGANIGCHALRMARLAKGGRVIAFEPMEWAWRRLRRNLQLNDLPNIEVEKTALSDVNGFRDIVFQTSWKIDPAEEDAALSPERVKFMTLDEYVKERSLQSVDLIKLDVDGYEYKVLRGGRRTLESFLPTLIMELGPAYLESVGDSFEELANNLFSLGYRFYSEKNFRPFADYAAIMESFPDQKKETIINIVARHPDNRWPFPRA